jgi:hypothetical protein
LTAAGLVPRADGFSARPGPVGVGVVADELVVVVDDEDEVDVEVEDELELGVPAVVGAKADPEVEVEVEPADGVSVVVEVDELLGEDVCELVVVEVELDVEDEAELVLAVVVDDVPVPVPDPVVQVSDSEPTTGTVSWAIGTPTGSGNWKVCPVIVVTVRVHASAIAEGSATDAIQATMATIATPTANSRRLAVTARSFSCDHHCSTALQCVVRAPHCAVRRGTY